MEFEQAELEAIERACRVQANFYRDLAMEVDRPIQRDQRMDAALELQRIADRIQQHRRKCAKPSAAAGSLRIDQENVVRRD